MNVVEKNKLKIILVITSILALMFIAIVGIEYFNERRRNKALKYYNEISTIVTLADTLGTDLECSDNAGKSWVITNQNEDFTGIVSRDIDDYISGKKSSLYNYKIIENTLHQQFYYSYNQSMHLNHYTHETLPIPLPQILSF